MNNRNWDEINEQDMDDYTNYGMYDIFSLCELYIKL